MDNIPLNWGGKSIILKVFSIQCILKLHVQGYSYPCIKLVLNMTSIL